MIPRVMATSIRLRHLQKCLNASVIHEGEEKNDHLRCSYSVIDCTKRKYQEIDIIYSFPCVALLDRSSQENKELDSLGVEKISKDQYVYKYHHNFFSHFLASGNV